MIEHLEVWKSLLLVTEAQLATVEATLAAAAPKELFNGEGELSHELIARELIDPQRFKNSRQVGNPSTSSGPRGYFGLCPSESSSGEKRRLGAITKHGSPRLRRLMIQLAWRVVMFQPAYRGLQRWREVLAVGVAEDLRRRARESHCGAGAAAGRRSLRLRSGHPLWRIATGRVKAGELGLTLRTCA